MKRNGFTIIEMMVVLVALSIVSISIFALYNQFFNIKEEVESKAKLKNLETTIYENLYSIDKVKALLGSSQYDLTTKTFDINSSIYYPDSSNNLQEILEPNKLSPFKIEYSSGNVFTSETEALSNFLGVYFNNDRLFYSNIFYYYTINTELLFGYIPISYQKITLLYIGDPKLSNFLKKGATPADFDEMFDTSKDYLIIKNIDPTTSSIPIGYIKNNWGRIKKKIDIIQFSTRSQIVDPLNHLKKELEASQKKINDWATIQARFEAYKSVSTGNTMNTDYFISCVANLTNGTCKNDTDIINTQTLIKLDDGITANPDNTVDFATAKALGNEQIQYEKINTNYGFVIFNGDIDTTNNKINISGIQDTTDGCSNVLYDDIIDINFEIDNAASIAQKNTMDGLGCFTSDNMGFLVENFNPFGYPIFFSNTKNPTINTGVGTIDVANNRYPDGNMGAPYNATIFTFLPNGAVISKKLYGHVF